MGVFLFFRTNSHAVIPNSLSVSKEHAELILPFMPGEELKYNVYSKGLKIGRSILTFHGETVLDGVECYHITFFTKIPFFEDKEEIFADKQTFLPIRVERSIRKAMGIRSKIIEEYDQKEFKVVIKQEGALRTKNQTIQKTGPIYNAILLTYYCRMMPYAAKNTPFNVVLPTSEYNVQISGEDSIEISSQEYPVIVYSSKPNKFTFYLATTDGRVPFKIESHTALDYTMILNSSIEDTP